MHVDGSFLFVMVEQKIYLICVLKIMTQKYVRSFFEFAFATICG